MFIRECYTTRIHHFLYCLWFVYVFYCFVLYTPLRIDAHTTYIVFRGRIIFFPSVFSSFLYMFWRCMLTTTIYCSLEFMFYWNTRPYSPGKPFGISLVVSLLYKNKCRFNVSVQYYSSLDTISFLSLDLRTIDAMTRLHGWFFIYVHRSARFISKQKNASPQAL